MTTATIDVDGARLVYSDSGAGLPLLCLHGGMGIDARSLHAPGILDLASHGIRLLIPDLRGHGESRAQSVAECSHAIWVTDARDLAVHLGLTRLAILGHSYGGFLALEYAVRWPEMLTHLVLVATSAGPVHVQSRPFGSNAELEEYFRERWPLFFNGEDKHWDLFNTLTFSAPAYNAAFTRELPRYDVRDRVTDLEIPMLLVVGRRDWYLPQMEWLAEHAKQATLCVLNDVGHFPFVEAPDHFVRAVASFLNNGYISS
jgi:proline iminopeptidase